MAEASADTPSAQEHHAPATVADVMRPALTTVDQNDHAAAAAYLMKHAGKTALVVLDGPANRPIGLITEADIVHTVADGKDVNEVRIRDLMTKSPRVIAATTSIRDAAETMLGGRFRHLPVVDGSELSGIVDIGDICRALLDQPAG